MGDNCTVMIYVAGRCRTYTGRATARQRRAAFADLAGVRLGGARGGANPSAGASSAADRLSRQPAEL